MSEDLTFFISALALQSTLAGFFSILLVPVDALLVFLCIVLFYAYPWGYLRRQVWFENFENKKQKMWVEHVLPT